MFEREENAFSHMQKLRVVSNTYHSSTWEAAAGGS
jgi:hypothetical protein